MVAHADLTGPNNIHSIYDFTYQDAAERNAASGFVSTDRGKVALQLDDSTFHILAIADPSPVWTPITVTPSAVQSPIYFRNTNITPVDVNSLTPTPLPWDNTNFLKSANITHDPNVNPEIVQVVLSGIYVITATAFFPPGGSRIGPVLTLYKNGSIEPDVGLGGGGYARSTGNVEGMSILTTMVSLASGDFVEVRSERGTTSSQVSNTISGRSVFHMFMLSPIFIGP